MSNDLIKKVKDWIVAVESFPGGHGPRSRAMLNAIAPAEEREAVIEQLLGHIEALLRPGEPERIHVGGCTETLVGKIRAFDAPTKMTEEEAINIWNTPDEGGLWRERFPIVENSISLPEQQLYQDQGDLRSEAANFLREQANALEGNDKPEATT